MIYEAASLWRRKIRFLFGHNVTVFQKKSSTFLLREEDVFIIAN